MLTADFLTEWLAGRVKMSFFHIDPLKIDLKSVTAVMSSPVTFGFAHAVDGILSSQYRSDVLAQIPELHTWDDG